jgi:hypothetical protein
MERYANLHGNSGVVGFEIGSTFIRVEFHDGAIYRYDAEHPGAPHVERMKVLARTGSGLSTYISQHVRDDYAAREPPGMSRA